MYCSYKVWWVKTSGRSRAVATRSAVPPSRKGWWAWTTSGRKALRLDKSPSGFGTGTEKSLPLKSRTAGKRTTSRSPSGLPLNSGAATSTRWPSRRKASVYPSTLRATPPTCGVKVLVIIKMFIRGRLGFL